ncbi:VOC family protein [Streptomyces monashensis]|uniref:Metapyrocatechase n=1 Tax=Streptomyces monashensis TaxID=1678012 RepID=A0A1S2PUF1_9ACTN|nr:VOC family protein [Streptomyces monashensis]OIJ97035.1 metapyrocatechase [Streptomyces monashensis]
MGESSPAPQPTRRTGLLGVHSLDSFSLAVPDLAVAEGFYRDFGLTVTERGNGLGLFTDDSTHCWGNFSEGRTKKLKHLSFGVFPDDLPRFARRLQHQGITRLDPPAGTESDGVWFQDCDGLLIELRDAGKSSPNEKSRTLMPASPPGTRCAPLRSETGQVRPRRLQHVLIFTRNVDRAVEFYGRVLGLRLSDQAGEVAFMHGVHGSDHHLLAFAASNGPGFHHCSWDVASVHDVGLGAMQMADQGFSAGWGLGRHVLGSNYFHYVRDPWGSYSEYSAAMDYIPCGMDWSAQQHKPENGFYLWGPEPPEGFAVNGEVA